MKKRYLALACLAALIFTGCAEALPAADASSASEETTVSPETVTEAKSEAPAETAAAAKSEAPAAVSESVSSSLTVSEEITNRAIEEFLALTKVPRPGFHLDKVREYLANYADARSYPHSRDEYGNFWMDVPASEGMENVPKVILQAHMDMVCVAEKGYDIDFETTGITAVLEGNTITADRTSLGADDGIGIGIILAIITSDVPHGPIRVLITADEDVGLLGAAALSPEALDADYLINVDDEETNEIICSSAGALITESKKQYETKALSADSEKIALSISGLLGGHSGGDIDKHRLSAVTVFTEIFKALADAGISYEIGSADGGTAQNAIAPHADAVIAVPKASSEEAVAIVKDVTERLRAEYPTEENLSVKAEKTAAKTQSFLSAADSKEYVSLLSSFPQGVIAMSEKIDGLVQTSENIGLFSVENGKGCIRLSSRSCVTEDLDRMRSELKEKMAENGYHLDILTDYPGWDGDMDTKLIRLVKEGYEQGTGEEVKIIPVHAGLECSWFAQKKPGIQLASIGPTIHDPHTVNETLFTDTIEPCVKAILNALEKIGTKEDPSAETASSERKAGTVVVLATGGTIAGSGDAGENGGYVPGSLSVEQLTASVPKLEDLCPIETVQVFNKASDDITHKDMAVLAQTINEMAADENIAGFVITHGTDTLEETAYFLQLTVKTDKPVVVTGSMRPATATSADGNQNLYEAVKVAGSAESAGRGVLVVLSDRIYSARFVTKTNNRSVTTMNAPMQGCMGEVCDDELHYYYHVDRKHTTQTEFDVSRMTFDKKVQIFYFGADAEPDTAQYIIDHSDGVIIAGAGDGAVSSACAGVIGGAKIPTVNASRTGSGTISYCGDDQGYLISGGDLNPQKAAILLTLALEVTDDPKEIRRMFAEY